MCPTERGDGLRVVFATQQFLGGVLGPQCASAVDVLAELGGVAEELRVAEEVVRHYTNMAGVEPGAYAAAVTDWGVVRGLDALRPHPRRPR